MEEWMNMRNIAWGQYPKGAKTILKFKDLI